MASQLLQKVRRKQKLRLVAAYSLIFISLAAAIILAFYIRATPPDTDSNSDTSEQTEVSDRVTVCTDLEVELESKAYKIERSPFQDTSCTVFLQQNPQSTQDMIEIFNKLYVFTAANDSSFAEVDLSNQDLRESLQAQSIADTPIIWSVSSQDFINTKFGARVGQRFTTDEQVVEFTRKNIDHVALIPLSAVEGDLKILPFRDQSPISQGFSVETYPLVDRYWAKGALSDQTHADLKDSLSQLVGEQSYEGNLTTILLTGRSAIASREQYVQIETVGQPRDYMFELISESVQEADIAHLSNHSSIAPNCTQAALTPQVCSRPYSIQTIKNAGFDIVSVNGTHALDIGRSFYTETLEEYKNQNLQTYGGGLNVGQARQSSETIANDNKILWNGYNRVASANALATNNSSGFAWPDARLLGDLDVLQTTINPDDKSVQIVEFDWGISATSRPNQIQISDARGAIDAGADIVFGTGGGLVQGYEEYNGGYIFYNLGNFSYTQSGGDQVRESIMLKITILDGDIVQIEPIAVYMDERARIRVADSIKKVTILQRMELFQ